MELKYVFSAISVIATNTESLSSAFLDLISGFVLVFWPD